MVAREMMQLSETGGGGGKNMSRMRKDKYDRTMMRKSSPHIN